MKKTISILALLVMFIFSLGCANAELEGSGYDTPEEAVLAYLEGMNQGDLSAMLSTFAFETFAANVDTFAYLNNTSVFTMEAYYGLPVYSDYAKALIANMRYGSLAKTIYYQYVEFTAHTDMRFVQLKEDDVRKEFLDAFDNSIVDDWRGNVEFVDWISPAIISQIANGKSIPFIGTNILKNYEFLNADDYSELAAHIRLNGVDAIQLMQCVKYGTKWYNRELSSVVAMMLGVNATSAGMVYPFTDADRYAINQAIHAVPDEQQLLYLTACQNSDLAGTKWKLSSVSDGSITVVDTPEKTLETARSAYADLHFIQMCSAMANIWISDELGSEMNMEA